MANPSVNDWAVLLQLDSDDETTWMWGDGGKLYFLVRRDRAGWGRFDQAWAVLHATEPTKKGEGVLAGQVQHNAEGVDCAAYLIDMGAGFEGLDANNLRARTKVERVVAAAWKKHKLEAQAGISTPNPMRSRPAF